MAVTTEVDARGTVTMPVVLSNITFTHNKGNRGSALHIGPASSVLLRNVHVVGNAAMHGAVFVVDGANLTLIDCLVADNSGPAMIFTGSSLNVSGTNFTNNQARVREGAQMRSKGAGGAVQLLCKQAPASACVGAMRQSWFEGNRGTNGGAVYCGKGVTLEFLSVVFRKNSATEGGAVFADTDACLHNVTDTTFELNSANGR